MSRMAEPTDHGEDRPPTALFVSDERGWPRTTGYRRRTSQLLGAVADLGPTTWVVAPRNRYDDGGAIVVPPELADRVSVIHAAAPDRPRWQIAARWVTSALPWSLAAGDWRYVDRHLDTLRARRFDLIWAMGIDAFLAVERAQLEATVTIVDADLESVKLRRQLETGRVPGRLRTAIARVDRRRWQRLERRTTATVTRFSVCSDTEREILGERAMTTPNCYPQVTEYQPAAGDVTTSPLLFIGSLSYGPNLDGLQWFMFEVLPILRERLPDAELRIVGSGAENLGGSVSVPGVTLVGRVDDVGQELARAAAVIVPIRWGAGTRIKILEAFAYRVPVVSTRIGAEGLGVRHQHELMLADDPARFADACLRVVTDPGLRDRLTENGHRTFAARYEESAVRHRLTTRLADLISSASEAPPISR